MKHDFRSKARKAIERAKVELALKDDERLKYAALELREAIEAITYDKAQSYQKELPPQEYATWQPRKLMQLLTEIDPHADQTLAISFGVKEEYGKPAKEMQFLGKEEPLTLANIKKHYDALGSYLHIPTLDQLDKGTFPNSEKIRMRCETIITIIEKVLASKVWNANFGNFAQMPCERCNAVIRKRIPLGQVTTEAHCFECGAPYLITDKDTSQVEWNAKGEEIPCANPSQTCQEKFFLFADEIKAGTRWSCNGCQMSFRIVLSIAEDQKEKQTVEQLS